MDHQYRPKNPEYEEDLQFWQDAVDILDNMGIDTKTNQPIDNLTDNKHSSVSSTYVLRRSASEITTPVTSENTLKRKTVHINLKDIQPFSRRAPNSDHPISTGNKSNVSEKYKQKASIIHHQRRGLKAKIKPLTIVPATNNEQSTSIRLENVVVDRNKQKSRNKLDGDLNDSIENFPLTQISPCDCAESHPKTMLAVDSQPDKPDILDEAINVRNETVNTHTPKKARIPPPMNIVEMISEQELKQLRHGIKTKYTELFKQPGVLNTKSIEKAYQLLKGMLKLHHLIGTTMRPGTRFSSECAYFLIVKELPESHEYQQYTRNRDAAIENTIMLAFEHYCTLLRPEVLDRESISTLVTCARMCVSDSLKYQCSKCKGWLRICDLKAIRIDINSTPLDNLSQDPESLRSPPNHINNEPDYKWSILSSSEKMSCLRFNTVRTNSGSNGIPENVLLACVSCLSDI